MVQIVGLASHEAWLVPVYYSLNIEKKNVVFKKKTNHKFYWLFGLFLDRLSQSSYVGATFTRIYFKLGIGKELD
jgi:alanine-alpha-ketoisovalerate/valine-pyruvate aminotransferase